MNDAGESPVVYGSVSRIGIQGSRFVGKDGTGRPVADLPVPAPDHTAACEYVLSWMLSRKDVGMPDAVGHRIVHGGSRYAAPEEVSAELVASLEKLITYAPGHMPQALQAVDHVRKVFPGTFQVACFDTAFHRSMPDVAQLYSLPESVRKKGVQRFGFHGLSCEYLMHELKQKQGNDTGRAILAHLGHGASMTAVRDGKSIDTTMGFSPSGGMVMGTRTGDLDPGVILFLLQQEGMSPENIEDMVNRRSGMVGISGTSGDMRDLLKAEKEESAAHEAVELFCYQARKHIGSLAAVLGGLDVLVFTGGIGEHSPEIRERICSGLEFLGITIDEEKNRKNMPVVSQEKGPVAVRIIGTNEEVMIARHTYRVLESSQQ